MLLRSFYPGPHGEELFIISEGGARRPLGYAPYSRSEGPKGPSYVKDFSS